ncbi:hypothetical protein BSPP4475_02485 [Brevibacillus aydinogluensis]|jgi:hypothetical protein|uniref:Uncharacterized protein n=1 Tax=Brevibacillus aydinogluensis TaxID=927786 RepID=A0AA48RFX5_9BACL|nr:hypothetical protein BSPP4475_02485 [Brevibacillus aydinogluensis]
MKLLCIMPLVLARSSIAIANGAALQGVNNVAAYSSLLTRLARLLTA